MRSTIILMLTLLTVSIGNVGRCADTAPAKPNVLFLICDDLNCDLGCYGHPLVKSPNVDRLAARGVRFENAYCQYPLCGPSRASFMSGLYPDQTLMHRNAVFLREHLPDVQTMSQMFRKNDYFVTRIGKIYHYGVPTNIGTSGHDDPLSWDYTINPRGRDKDNEAKVRTLVRGTYGGTLSWLPDDGADEEQTDGIGATEAIAQLRKYASQKRQFMLAVGIYRPHTPYVSPKRYFDMYPPDKIQVPKVPKGYLETLPAPARLSIHRKKDQIDLPEKIAREAMQAYYAAISFADAQIGRILNALDESGLADKTIVVFTSDHGYHMGEHGHWQKITLFENATRVPLIISVPGMKTAGQSTKSLAEMVDFYPTLAELCGLAPPDYLSGVSLAAVLNDPAAKPRDSALTQFDTGYSVRTSQFRYTEWGKDGADGNELYDHESDPAEMVNLAKRPEHADTIASLSKLLHERIADAQRAPKGVVQRDYVIRKPAP
ncbi:MAG: sulfatase [Planctomycetaceae bacterium]